MNIQKISLLVSLRSIKNARNFSKNRKWNEKMENKGWKEREKGKFFICNNVMDEKGSWKDTHLFWIEARERETGIWRWIYTVKTKQIYRYSKEFQNAAEVKGSKKKW